MLLSAVIAIAAPSSANSDYITLAPEVVQVPKSVPIENVKYFLMVHEAFKNDPVMIDIATAENNRFDPVAKNPGSSATGLFQIISGTWRNYKCEGDVKNAADNITCAKKIKADSGTSPWNESKSVWGKT